MNLCYNNAFNYVFCEDIKNFISLFAENIITPGFNFTINKKGCHLIYFTFAFFITMYFLQTH